MCVLSSPCMRIDFQHTETVSSALFTLLFSRTNLCQINLNHSKKNVDSLTVIIPKSYILILIIDISLPFGLANLTAKPSLQPG